MVDLHVLCHQDLLGGKLLDRSPRGVEAAWRSVKLSGRVTFASVVIVSWWHFNVLEYRPGLEEFCFCQAAWQEQWCDVKLLGV